MSASVDVWAALAAPLPKSAIAWRQDGKPFQRDGKTIARFVAYVGSGAVRERLDAIVPGEWTVILDPLPAAHDTDGVEQAAFKARLSIQGIAREDVGLGKDVKAAATDSFKRAAMRFGIGNELHVMSVFVQLDGEGKGARPVEDPQAAWDRKHPATAKAPATESTRAVVTVIPASNEPVRAVVTIEKRAPNVARPPSPPMINPFVPGRSVPKPSHARAPEPPPLDDADQLPF
jgi:hypothetical protein